MAEGEKRKEWWQLKRIWFGFLFIISVITFGMAQPLLWRCLFGINPPEGAIDMSNLLLIVITLLALGLTGFSVLIYEALQERLLDDVHKDIEVHVDGFKKLLKRTEEEGKNHQTLFGVRMLRSLGYNYWQLFLIWEEVKMKHKSTPDIHAKKISEDLITLAIEKTKISLDLSEKLPEQYKEEVYRSKTNWMYFLAEAVRVNGFEPTWEDKKLALNLANEILEEVSKQKYPDKQKYEDYYEYQESCAWALQHLSKKDDENTKKRAQDIIQKLQNDGSIRPSWHDKIKKKWEVF